MTPAAIPPPDVPFLLSWLLDVFCTEYVGAMDDDVEEEGLDVLETPWLAWLDAVEVELKAVVTIPGAVEVCTDDAVVVGTFCPDDVLTNDPKQLVSLPSDTVKGSLYAVYPWLSMVKTIL